MEKYIKEFPFLKKLPYSLEYNTRISVGRIKDDVLDTTPAQMCLTSALRQTREGEEFYIFDKCGKLLGTVQPTTFTLDDTARKESRVQGENVLDAIYRLGAEDTAHYIVWVSLKTVKYLDKPAKFEWEAKVLK